MENNLTWKEVLDSDKKFHGDWMKFFENIVLPSGYKYFTWNDRVYKVVDGETFEDTKMLIEDIR